MSWIFWSPGLLCSKSKLQNLFHSCLSWEENCSSILNCKVQKSLSQKCGALSPSPLGGVICVTCPDCLRYIRWLESCFYWIVRIPLYVRIAGAELAVFCGLHHLLLPSQGFISLSFEYLFSQLSPQAALRCGEMEGEPKGGCVIPSGKLQGQLRALFCAPSVSGVLELLSKALRVAVFTSALCAVNHQLIQYKTLYSFIMHKKYYLEKVMCRCLRKGELLSSSASMLRLDLSLLSKS